MNARRKKVFFFVDANLTTAEKGSPSLLKDAKSHAATRTHRRRSGPTLTSQSDLDGHIRNKSSDDNGNGNQQGQLAIWETDGQDSSRRLAALRRTRSDEQPSSTIDPSLQRDNADSQSYTGVLLDFSIPIHKGNSDPFGANAVDFNSFELGLIQSARTEAVKNLWASEVAIYQRPPAIVSGTRNVLDFTQDVAAAYGALSHACVVHARKYRNQDHIDRAGEMVARKHYARCVEHTRQLLDEQARCPSRASLHRLLGACNWLASIETCLGNRNAAQTHSRVWRKIFDQLGGLRTLPVTDIEVYVQFLVISAGFDHKRPIIHADEWDPGAWSENHTELEGCSTSKSTNTAPASRISVGVQATNKPTTASDTLITIFDETRELLTIEEVKVRAPSIAVRSEYSADQISRMFRWSHLRKNTVRARALLYWCDLAESAHCTVTFRENSGTVPMPSILGTSTFEMCLCLAARLFDRCIFEEHYLPGGLFRQCRAFHALLVSCLSNLQPTFQGDADDRRFDLLWIYSVGAYAEAAFLQQGGNDDPAHPSPRFFSVRFELLASKLSFPAFEELSRFLEAKYLYCARLQEACLRRCRAGLSK